MKKFFSILTILMIIMGSFYLMLLHTSCEDVTDDSMLCSMKDSLKHTKKEITRGAVQLFQRGINVEESEQGIYLSFFNKDVVQAFVDHLDSLSQDEKDELMQTYYDQGFYSLNKWEEEKQIDEQEKHPNPLNALIINAQGLIKIADTLYRDDKAMFLYQIDEKGTETLVASRSGEGNKLSKSLERVETEVYNDDISIGYNGKDEVRLAGRLIYEPSFFFNDKVRLRLTSFCKPAYLTEGFCSAEKFSVYATYDVNVNNDNVKGNFTQKTLSGYNSPYHETTLLEYDDLTIGYIYVTAYSVSKLGKREVKLRME